MPKPRFLSSDTLPDLDRLQQSLIQGVLSAAQHLGLDGVLTRCTSSPRFGLALPANAQTRTLLQDLMGQGLRLAHADTHKPITDITTLPSAVSLYCPITCQGRVIHGPTSGITLALGPAPASTPIPFPDARFGTRPINAALSGKTVSVSHDLLDRIASDKTPQTVDVVYTWVDDSDPTWAANRHSHNPDIPAADALHSVRFKNNDELLYSLRALFRYVHGLGRVYLVTDAQVPVFFGEFADRVTVVDHADIMGDDVARPTFNSHAIESCLHRIKGLGEQYLYLNDDFFFAKPACPADFFDTDGKSKCFFSNRSFIPKGQITDQTLAVDAAAINLRDLLAARFDHKITRKFQHTPVAIHRDILFEMEREFPDEFAQLRQNRFRARNDLSPSSSFYLHYALMTERAVPATIKYRYYEISARALPLKLFKLSVETDVQRPVVHCINATGDRTHGVINDRALHKQLRALYPSAQTRAPMNSWRDPWRRKLYRGTLALARKLRKTLRSR